jgi:hypothetical protein
MSHYATYLGALSGIRRIHSFGIFFNFKVNETEPIVCPKCGKELHFDKDFHFEFGSIGISFLKSRLGIEPLFG